MNYFSLVFLLMVNYYRTECEKIKLYKDINTIYWINGVEVNIEAYQSLENRKIIREKDSESYRLLEWYSIGYPVVIESETKTKPSNKSFFHFTQKGFYAQVQMLTIDQKRLVIQQIKKVHNICVDLNQINELKVSRFDCEIELYGDNDDDLNVLSGYVRSFKTDPLRIEFKYGNDSKEQQLLKNYLSDKINDIELFCEISSYKYGYHNHHKVKIQLFKPVLKFLLFFFIKKFLLYHYSRTFIVMMDQTFFRIKKTVLKVS